MCSTKRRGYSHSFDTRRKVGRSLELGTAATTDTVQARGRTRITEGQGIKRRIPQRTRHVRGGAPITEGRGSAEAATINRVSKVACEE